MACKFSYQKTFTISFDSIFRVNKVKNLIYISFINFCTFFLLVYLVYGFFKTFTTFCILIIKALNISILGIFILNQFTNNNL